jgi:hypothetical protein
MNKISIPADKAYDAIIWASVTFGSGSFGINNLFPSKLYEFSFSNPENATYFALQWA